MFKEKGYLLVFYRNFNLQYLPFLLFITFCLMAIHYSVYLLNYKEWGDESETIVTTKMLAAGQLLYEEVFNHHGPLTFLPGYFLELTGSYGISEHRFYIIFLIGLSALSIYFSPIFKNSEKLIKYISVTIYLTMVLVYLPEKFGHMYKYQVLAGIMLVIILSQHIIPSILKIDNVNSYRLKVCNILISSLPFLAITYLPVAVMLFVAAITKTNFIKSLKWFAIGFILNILFLSSIGSIKGFFAYHVFLNLIILPDYNGVQSLSNLIINAWNSINDNLGNFILFLAVIVSLFSISKSEKGIPWRTLIVLVAIGTLLIRGSGFHGLPYFYAAFFISVVGIRFAHSYNLKLLTFGILTIAIFKLALIFPGEVDKFHKNKIPTDSEFSRVVNLFTQVDDRVIAYSFRNFEYIISNRLPASGHFFYLPWQEKYNESPVLGIAINACQDIKEYRPKVMLIDKWTVWGRFPWNSYASCIQTYIDKEYFKVPGKPFYIRNDLISDSLMHLGNNDIDRKMVPSPVLSDKDPIKIKGLPKITFDKVGLYIGTHKRTNLGSAILKLTKNNGQILTKSFDLATLSDNSYNYFNIDNGKYIDAEIIYGTGGGVSLWESKTDYGETMTCINYLESGRLVKNTAGCPFF